MYSPGDDDDGDDGNDDGGDDNSVDRSEGHDDTRMWSIDSVMNDGIWHMSCLSLALFSKYSANKWAALPVNTTLTQYLSPVTA